ncbi:MAG: hypothetical protein M5U01_42675 [Ardenticatenaceae bacterium]|nr:hypothetical protein [Ardenticatenaceae bacterium]
MKVYVIGDENAVLGCALVGIEGRVVLTLPEAHAALDAALHAPDVAIVLITEEWAGQMREEVDRLKMTILEPLILEIPSMQPARPALPLRVLVAQALGINLGG